MRSRAPRALAGALTALVGLAVAQLLARLLSTKDGPVEAVGTWIIRHPPGHLTERAIKAVGHADKPILVTGVVIVVTVVVGVLAAGAPRVWVWAGMAVLAVVAALAVVAQPGTAGWRLVPIAAGFVTWIVVLPALLDALPPDSTARNAGFGGREGATRRGFLVRVGVVAALGAIAALGSRYAGGGRRQVEQARAALQLPGVTQPTVPAGADLGVDGQPGWLTSTTDFYRIDTALLAPAVDPATWRLRIHGMVDHPMELSLDELLARELTEDWLTLCCVSNTVGGDLIGNAWWSGVRIAPLLAEAGIHPDADGVLQTSSDGWTCLTPVEALTDDRNAMLAVAMNGAPLPVEHGFPVRMVVPGLYGYVSATKWLVDLEVTRFDKAEGYWTPLGWSAKGPIKLGSRVDTPGYGDTAKLDGEGRVVIAGTAWHQHTGIKAVEVSVDGGPWTAAELATEPTIDSWVQWRVAMELESGLHNARVRATGADGEVQTGAVADPAPDGATGWDKHTFEVA
ncbi:molybdopterin-dependent oxidoreductase [Nocardioides sp. Kera G14]|uniref:molybdopterin-dependent oxidoreductase n=1 Tax=Nocardioides sp. Kera G14 TaxID=2884264 RepID=UPI001D11598C|nr:molybdopterin-dependent oxidoreductase [Nocardioides sp. Kera G14]UDY24188.1 molybdopterin-dependent oxidoreductase [Nocardioides sp. Kera G14]